MLRFKNKIYWVNMGDLHNIDPRSISKLIYGHAMSPTTQLVLKNTAIFDERAKIIFRNETPRLNSLNLINNKIGDGAKAIAHTVTLLQDVNLSNNMIGDGVPTIASAIIRMSATAFSSTSQRIKSVTRVPRRS